MSKIKNFKQLASTSLRRTILAIVEEGLRVIDSQTVIKRQVHLKNDTLLVGKQIFDLGKFQQIFVVGVGKCALEAAQALEDILGKRVTAGIVIDIHPGKLRRMKAYSGTHPLPTEKNIDVTKEIIKLLQKTGENDLVIFLISGGGSTLLCQPTNFTCVQESSIVRCLSRAGANIQEINTVRKHLSLARGGYLAKYAYPSRVVSLIFSDVPGDDLGSIASGPTVKDSTTVKEARKILLRYDVDKCSEVLLEELIETPKTDKYFAKVQNIILVNNKIALLAMAAKAKRLNLKARIMTARLSGEARKAALRIIKDLEAAASKSVLLYGGETSVLLKNLGGRGGRNLELALAGLRKIRPNQIIVPFATDGMDNTNFAGAICDIITKEQAAKLKLDINTYLNQNQSYKFFNRINQYILTGDTGSNVSDLVAALKN